MFDALGIAEVPCGGNLLQQRDSGASVLLGEFLAFGKRAGDILGCGAGVEGVDTGEVVERVRGDIPGGGKFTGLGGGAVGGSRARVESRKPDRSSGGGFGSPNRSSVGPSSVKMLAASSTGGGSKVVSSSWRGETAGICGSVWSRAGACAAAGAMTTCWQCGQRTCRPRYSALTPMRLPQWPHLKFTVCS